jgi:hypothetical protein
MHQSAQTRIGFDHTGIDSQMPTFEKPVRFERREHHLENPLDGSVPHVRAYAFSHLFSSSGAHFLIVVEAAH